VFHAVSLFDSVTVASAESDTVRVTGEGADLVPEDGDNLALRAVRLLRKAVGARAGVGGGVAVTIDKRIPVAGGMAGGSADAAAALVGVNELWDAGLSQAELVALAGDVGSDVAFAVLGGTAIGEGRGERLTPVTSLGPVTYHWVIALADGHLSTPTVFRELDRQREGQGGRLASEPELSAELMSALQTGDPAALGPALTNDLQDPALTLFPELRKTLDAGREAGARGALISGSGPTCFFLTDSAQHAVALAAALESAGACRRALAVTGPVAGATIVASEMP
jgi:4-diphosphocytidyl-2-C-methyl-D-erythritol kinase